MTMSFEAPQVGLSARAHALALRMLSGAGAASVDAYRLGECLEFVAHGMTSAGELVLAASPVGELSRLADAQPAEVRLDIVKHTPDPSVSLVAASLHMLGSMTWVESVEGELPERVASLAAIPGVRLAVVEIERAVLHDMAGASVIDTGAPPAVGPALDEQDAFRAVARQGQSALKDLCWAVMVDAVPGEVASKAALPNLCAHTVDSVYCVDVDALGITLMLVGRHETLIAHAAFATPAISQAALERRVDELVRGARI